VPLIQRANDFYRLQPAGFFRKRLVQPGKGLLLIAERSIKVGNFTGVRVPVFCQLFPELDFPGDSSLSAGFGKNSGRVLGNCHFLGVIVEGRVFLPLFHSQVVLACFAVDVAQLDVGVREVWIHLQRFFQLFQGGVHLSGIGQDLTEVALVLQIQGIEFDCTAKMGNGLLVTRLPGQKESEPVMGISEIGV